MSKIYEALIRAEQERAARENDPKAPSGAPESRRPSSIWSAVATLETEAAHPPPVETPRDQDPLPDPPFVGYAPPIQPAAASAPAAAAIPLQDASLLEAVPFRPWKPVLSQLPALLERGAAVEQFRSLRSRIQEFRDLNTLKSLMVSSGVPQEGKTFIAANLAISLARHDDSRVLLIDGDMRRPALHKMLGCSNAPGLTEYLAGGATLHEVMQRAQLDAPEFPVPGGLRSLTFIAGGADAERAADLSGNDRFTDLIRTAAPLFDWIIVDSSPVNLVADGVNLSRSCDGVLLIARAGTTKYEVTQRALAELKAAKVLGIVLNAVVDPPVAEGYYGYDGYVGNGSDSR